jgi:tetratricopeptide (TPR) repeat protein
VRILRALAVAAAIAFLLRPEIARYRAERRLGAANAAFEYILDRPTEIANIPAILDRVAAAAVSAAPDLPGDSRAWVLAGSCQLVRQQGERALEYYREGLAAGERAEIHLNVGRAHVLLGESDYADASFLRAVWISPALLKGVPKEFTARVETELKGLEADLASGRLSAPPGRAD